MEDEAGTGREADGLGAERRRREVEDVDGQSPRHEQRDDEELGDERGAEPPCTGLREVGLLEAVVRALPERRGDDVGGEVVLPGGDLGATSPSGASWPGASRRAESASRRRWFRSPS